MGIRGPVTPQQQEQLGRIKRSQDHLLGIINDILNFSRIEAGQVVYDIETVPVSEVAHAVAPMIMPQAESKGVRIVERTDPKTFVQADRSKLEQVLLNLLSNAVKFTPEGGAVDVTVAGAEAAYTITVQDSGMGIDPAFLPRVFDRFQQADSSTTREHSGLGLGLPLVKEIAALHFGTVVASSAGTGRGTTFTLTLPRLVDAELADAGVAGAPRIVAVDPVSDAS
jgi:signal transduction histidine kinase